MMTQSNFFNKLSHIFHIGREEKSESIGWTNRKPLNMWWAAIACAILGAFYGLYVVSTWSEAVEFAQSWAGLITYPKDNPWGQILLGDSSLQISFPALLLHYGVDSWRLSLASTTFCCALAFTAAGTISFALTRQFTVAIIGALALLTYTFANPFGYPTVYPFTQSQFGQTGQHLCMIALAFIASRYYKTASIIAGSLAAIHPIWWIAYLLGVFPVLFLIERPRFKRVVAYIVAASFLWVLMHKLCLSLLPPIEHLPKNAALSGMHTNSDSSTPVRETFELHNILLGDSPSPWHSTIGMFLPVVLWALFSGVYALIVRRQRINSDPASSGTLLLAMPILPLCCAAIYQCIAEVDPYFNLFAKLNPYIPGLLLRGLINRWLNLAGFILPLLPLALLTILAIHYRSLLALAALVYMTYFCAQPWIIGLPYQALTPEAFTLHMQPHGYFFIAVLVLAAFNRWEPKINLWFIPRLYQAALWLICLICIDHHWIAVWNQSLQRNQELAAGKFDQIIAIAKEEKGSIIYAPDIRGGGGFLPQLAINRPSILPLYISVNTPYADIYCYTNPKERIDRFMSRARSCFEERTKHEWLVLAQRTHATALITPQTWKLDLTLTFAGGGLNYYRLP